jgi:hypothetical protein
LLIADAPSIIQWLLIVLTGQVAFHCFYQKYLVMKICGSSPWISNDSVQWRESSTC